MNQRNTRQIKPYCPSSGCGMPNGAAMPVPVTCKNCQNPLTNMQKVCPSCHFCIYCVRISKKQYLKLKESI